MASRGMVGVRRGSVQSIQKMGGLLYWELLAHWPGGVSSVGEGEMKGEGEERRGGEGRDKLLRHDSYGMTLRDMDGVRPGSASKKNMEDWCTLELLAHWSYISVNKF